MLNNTTNILNKRTPKTGIIGAGFAGMAAAAVMAANGATIDVFEKNDTTGGRARQYESNGFVFDMGPSWYWMPDVFERYFNLFDHTASDFYNLVKLDPGFKVIFGKDDFMDVPAGYEELRSMFEGLEKGSADKLDRFMKEAEFKYHTGINDLVYQPGLSIMEFADVKLIKNALRLQIFASFSKHVRRYFKDSRLIALLEFPILFLGAQPQNTPALYSLMNFAGLKLGTWYPMGGFGKVADAFKTIATEAGATIHTSSPVERLELNGKLVSHVHAAGKTFAVDAVIGSADYHHIERNLIPEKYKNYKETYWGERTFAPSCLIFYLGINRKIAKLHHHNLFFDEDFDSHATEIYQTKKWPTAPLFYVCCPSKTDDTVAPQNCENLFILMPIATGLDDNPAYRDLYYRMLMDRLEKFTGQEIRKDVIYKKSYSVSDFAGDYNAYKGNAYGLANTLFQTATFKPSIRSKKIKNLFFAGQLTVPGPGVPPSIISGQVAAKELLKYLKRNQ